MSVEAMTIALHHSRATGAAKVVLLGIANHDGDGGAWPSVATLAKYANCTPRAVQRHIQKLIDLGEISRSIQGGGTTQTENHMRPNLYHFLLKCPPSCDRTRQHRVNKPVDKSPSKGVTELSPGDRAVTPGGDEAVTLTIPRTTNSIDTQGDRSEGTQDLEDKSVCWDRWINNYRHSAGHADTTKPWACIRCGSISQPVKTLAEIHAELRGE